MMTSETGTEQRLVQLRFRPLWLYVGDEKDLEVRMEHDATGVVIRFANTAATARVSALQKLFATMSTLSPQEAYAQALSNAATRPENESGLGLPRIHCEGNVELELEVTPGRVRVTARGVA